MASIKEMVEDEAARAEAEGDDETPAEGDETPPTDPMHADPAAPGTDEGDEAADDDETKDDDGGPTVAALPRDSLTISDELSEKREAQAKSQARNVERLADEYGQDVAECPVCERVDLAALIVAKVQEMPAEAWQALAGVGGHEPEPEHAPAEGVVMCPTCNGYGELDYPTRNEHVKRQMCPKCSGQGYIPEQHPEHAEAAVFTLPPIPSPTAPANAAFGSHDQWGRPPGHPHWGLDPAAVMP